MSFEEIRPARSPGHEVLDHAHTSEEIKPTLLKNISSLKGLVATLARSGRGEKTDSQLAQAESVLKTAESGINRLLISFGAAKFMSENPDAFIDVPMSGSGGAVAFAVGQHALLKVLVLVQSGLARVRQLRAGDSHGT